MDHNMMSMMRLLLLLLLLLVSYSSVESFSTQQYALTSVVIRQQTHQFMIDDKVFGTLSYSTMKRGKVDIKRPTNKLLTPQSGTWFSYSKMSSSSSALHAFLPPGGGGGGGGRNDISQIKDIGTIALVVGGIILFFISPLGALFFTVMNSLLVISIVLPLIGILSFTIWSYFSTISGICPNCGTPVTVPKDESPSLCLNCGTILQSKNGIIAVANLNNDGGMFSQQQDGMNDDIFTFFRSPSTPPPPRNDNIFGREGGRNGRRPSIDMYDDNDDDEYEEYQRRRQRTNDRIIDIDIEPDEPPPRRRWF